MWDAKRIVDPAWFLDRQETRERLRDLVAQRDNILVYGQRRLGKTSLIRRVAADLPDTTFLFVDCNFVDTEEELSRHILAALQGTDLARTRRFLEWARQAMQGLEIGVEVRQESISPFVRRGTPRPRPLEDALQFLTRIAVASRRHVVLVLDEFQTVITDAHDAVAKLRGHAQGQRDVSYLVAGSRPSILLGLTRHKSPFWRQLTEFHVGPIDVGAALDDVERLTGEAVPEETRAHLSEATQGNTQRLAELLDILWRGGSFDPGAVDAAMDVLLDRHKAGFERILGQLTAYQRRLAIAVAVARPRHLTGSGFVQDHGLRSASHVQRGLQGLQREEILDDEDRFIDPAFATWLRRHVPVTP